MDPKRRPVRPQTAWYLALAAGLAIALTAACTPGSGLPSQPQGTSDEVTGTHEASGSTPNATSSSGGSVVPVIEF